MEQAVLQWIRCGTLHAQFMCLWMGLCPGPYLVTQSALCMILFPSRILHSTSLEPWFLHSVHVYVRGHKRCCHKHRQKVWPGHWPRGTSHCKAQVPFCHMRTAAVSAVSVGRARALRVCSEERSHSTVFKARKVN